MNNPLAEKISYNAVNIALNGDHRKIKSIKNNSWEELWSKIAKDFPLIDPNKEYERLIKSEINLILNEDKDFPDLLKEIPWPPFAIYIKGKLNKEKSVAIVGTRRTTIQGKETAKKIAKQLAENDLQIISGLALGVDESAHQGALEAEGTTVAVLPTGLGNIYPKQNQSLAEKIVKNKGALISEFPIDFRPYASSFIQRNRIISALSLATIIIEAPEKSGALATARFALEQNREIFVLPGPANHPNYKGSHKFIREGARLVTCAKDILEDMGIENENLTNSTTAAETNKITGEEKIILEAIKQLGWPASVDKISENTKIQVQKVNQIIVFLTIKGILK
jgi:DNA processing protein